MLELMIYVLLFFVGASIVLYVVLGGADYGAGILELLPSKGNRAAQKKLINSAMGPVWEANHMWLVIVVVILFMGFPKAFQNIMVSLHLPMVALLLGIVIRGSTFTFRHYDAKQTGKSQKFYSAAFSLSSLWTSIWLGIIAASLFRGKINPSSLDFVEAYIDPWWGFFPFSMGIFTSVIFAYLSAVFLAGEATDIELKKFYVRRASYGNIGVVITGGLVFFSSYIDGQKLFIQFIQHPISIMSLLFASLSFGILWFFIEKRNVWLTRLLASIQVGFILVGWFALNWPNALNTVSGPISFFEAAAPEPTIYQLNLALLIGSLFIFPSLFYLIKVFKSQNSGPN